MASNTGKRTRPSHKINRLLLNEIMLEHQKDENLEQLRTTQNLEQLQTTQENFTPLVEALKILLLS